MWRDHSQEGTLENCRCKSAAFRKVTAMRASVYYAKLIGVSALVAALGCGGDQGPYPHITLTIRGQVLTADPTPIPVAGATVALREFLGLTSSQTLAHTTTGQTGNYQLTYTFTSTCGTQDNTLDWIEASADGYEIASTFSNDDPSLPTWPSDPPIYCTNEPQVINLSLKPFGALQMITNSSGSGLDPDGYTLLLFGKAGFPGGLGYTLGLNDEWLIELLPGQYSLELTEVAGNCTVAGENPRTVTVAARETTFSTFQVTCAP